MDKFNNVSNINVASGYRKFKIYYNQYKLGLKTDSYPLIDEQAPVEVSYNASEVYK